MTDNPKPVVTKTKEAVVSKEQIVSKDQKQAAAGPVTPVTPVKQSTVDEVDRTRD